MAEESRAKRTTSEDMIFMLFALLLVGQMLQRVPVLIEEHLGIDLSGGTYLTASAALSVETPLGSTVNVPGGASFYGSATDEGTPLGTFAPGTSLTLIGGPETAEDGTRWWFVEDASGQKGWVPESALVREGVGGIDANTKLGSKARALMDSELWRTPGSLISEGTMKMGEWGKLTDGPIVEHGSRWWFFDRDDSNKDGWVTEAVLVLASDSPWREGSAVRATHATDLFERAGGGRTLGYLAGGGNATILGGPIEVGGTYWWLIETENGTQGWVPESVLEDAGVRGWLKGTVATLLIVGTIVTVVLLGGIVYATIRTNQIRAREAKRIREAIPKAMQPKRNERWDKVLGHVSSDNPNDWRLAVIEADVMLDELITRMGYIGTTLGDKLKQATKGDIKSLDAAWEAHRVRNQVAHAGSDYILTQYEARRVIELYGKVFEEFQYI